MVIVQTVNEARAHGRRHPPLRLCSNREASSHEYDTSIRVPTRDVTRTTTTSASEFAMPPPHM